MVLKMTKHVCICLIPRGFLASRRMTQVTRLFRTLLELEPQCKLDDARVRGACNPPEGGGLAGRARAKSRVDAVKVGVIENIEEFRTKVKRDPLAQMKVL